ncbi:hypothetical protein E4T48_05331 [Aureobasidium sp. EXF-10727]|nr:hypothetical protein E4T48_05331 [Aureobasidium sp. EXF-10727]
MSAAETEDQLRDTPPHTLRITVTLIHISSTSPHCFRKKRTMAVADDARVLSEVPVLLHAIAILIKCIAFYVAMCGLRVLVVDVLKLDLGPAVKAMMESSQSHFKAPTFQAQGGNWSSEDPGQEKREV